MSFYRKIKYFLVHTLHYSNKEAQNLIETHCVSVNGLTIRENVIIDETSTIAVNGLTVRNGETYIYLKFNKPAGFESSLNDKVKNNLSSFFTQYTHLSIAGRLDKASEGLLILSNNGKWVENMCHPRYQKEKEYEVLLDKPLTEQLKLAFLNGIFLDGKVTIPALLEEIEPCFVRITLKEGRNRQIRRMCHKSGFKVLNLKRVRIATTCLNGLSSGGVESFTPSTFT